MYGYQAYPYQNNYNSPMMVQPPPMQQMPQMQQNQQIPSQTNTNKIFVSGMDDVRNRFIPPNSDFIFLDNDKPIIYQKVVDGKGQFEVKAFAITPYSAQETAPSTDMSNYVTVGEFNALKDEIKSLQEKLVARQGGNNGTAQGTKM